MPVCGLLKLEIGTVQLPNLELEVRIHYHVTQYFYHTIASNLATARVTTTNCKLQTINYKLSTSSNYKLRLQTTQTSTNTTSTSLTVTIATSSW